jgi:diphosphomevalonate decarboxylase
LEICRDAILSRDFNTFASIVELDSDMLHAVMMTSTPSLHYWQPETMRVMNAVRQWRNEGIPACYTIDAGANVHVLCLEAEAHTIDKRLREIEGVKDVLVARAGGPARVVENGE